MRAELAPAKENTVIPQRYAAYVFAFFMSLIMSGVMSLFISLVNIGVVDGILGIWLRAWALAFTVAFPTVTAVSPLVRRLVWLCVTSQEPLSVRGNNTESH